MTLPANGLLSPVAHPSAFISPRDRKRVPFVDRCRGGFALNDATRGLNLYEWTYSYNEANRQVSVEAVGFVASALVHTLPVDADEIAGAFDTNMQPVIGWNTFEGVAAFRWFDPVVSSFVVVNLAAGTTDVRIVLDDVRPGQSGTGATDAIITYLRAGSLYYRHLRDRFVTEFLLKTGLEEYKIGQFGPARKLRLQWQLYKPVVTA